MSMNVSARFVLWLISFFGYAVQFMFLTNLNIAITDMVERPRTVSLSDVNVTSNLKSHVIRFSWNEAEEGIVLSGFFWILWISHLLGGMLSHQFGAKIVVVCSIIIGSIFNLLIPWAAVLDIKVLLVVRILQGFVVGLSFPSVVSVMQFWIPEDEKGRFLSCILGVSFGAAATYFISGFIIQIYHWKGVFYVTGLIGLVWCVAWWYLMYNKPEKHPRISEKEKLYIFSKTRGARNSQNIALRRRRVPWIHIFRTIEFYVNVVCQFGIVWISFTLMIYGPKYMQLFHNLDPAMTGIVSGVPHFFRVFFTIGFATLIDKLTTKKIMTLTNARKFSVFIGSIITGIILIVLAYFGENFIIAVLCLFLIIGFSGAGVPGTVAGLLDISPNFGGVLQGLTGTITQPNGFLIPFLVGNLTLNNDTIEQWQKIFLISGAISIISGIIFIWLWHSDVQEWDRESVHKWDQSEVYLNGVGRIKTKNENFENS